MITTDDQTLAHMLRPTFLKISRALKREAHIAGNSANHAHLLGAILNAPGIEIGALAAKEQVSAASISITVKRLEGEGWVERISASKKDRRRVGVRLTDRGLMEVESIRGRRNDLLARRLGKLSDIDRELIENAAAALARLAEDSQG